MMFVVDSMLGRLAKWLRLIGYDTLYFSSISDSDLLRIGKFEYRIILTRDTLFMQRREVKRSLVKVLFIESEHLFVQLKQVLKDLEIKPDFSNTRCKYDNNKLVKINKYQVKGMVPPYTYKTQEEFVKCDKCHRIYWKATQWKNIEQQLEDLRLN